MNFRSSRCLTDTPGVLIPVGPRDRRGQPLRWWISALALLGVVACKATTPSPEATAEASSTPSRSLTSGDTALTNLSSRIGGLRSALKAQPTATALRGDLVGHLLARAQFVGSFADLGESLSLAADGRGLSSDQKRAIETEASALGAVHEFARATDLLASIEKTESDAFGNLQLARGDDPRPIEQERHDRALESPNFSSLSSWAIALAAVGEFEAADAAYADALRNYRDVSPLPVAWVAFQRGVMWAERAGDTARGRAYYDEATRVLPEYVAANVHLAEIDVREGHVDVARSRLVRVIEAGTEDPEPYGLLSKIAANQSDRDRLRELTKSRYLSLIERYPRAFLDHGAEFFSTVDPEFALELALANLEIRTEDRAYQVGLQAALAADDVEAACDLARQATLEAHPGFLRPTVPLRELAHEVLEACE